MISAIVAMAENGVIGVDNSLPWHLPSDLKRFRAVTTGHTIIMGRKNYESIGRPLPNRRNVVVTRNLQARIPGCEVVHSLEQAIEVAGDDPEIFVIGGGEIYRQALPVTERLYVTRVHADIRGDTYFPKIDPGEWRTIFTEAHPADATHAYPFTFLVLERTTACV